MKDNKFQPGKIQKGGVNEKPEYTERPAPPRPQRIAGDRSVDPAECYEIFLNQIGLDPQSDNQEQLNRIEKKLDQLLSKRK